MSFLGDIVNSIGGDKVPAPPLRPPSRPLNSNVVRPTTDAIKGGPRAPPFSASPQNGLKRKAEDDGPKPPVKTPRPNPGPGLTSTIRRAPAPPLNKPRTDAAQTNSVATPPLQNGRSSVPAKIPPVRPVILTSAPISTNPPPKVATPTTTTPSTGTKPPIKGSYADLMARASQGQQQTQNKVGMIKHAPTTKEKTSKLAERKKAEEERVKADSAKGKPGARPLAGREVDRKRTGSPSKKAEPVVPPKSGKPNSRAPTSSYKGTMGAASGRSRQPERRKSRQDDYMDTDEEDEDDWIVDDEDDDEGKYHYASDASSDMEAGAFDLDQEEREADRAARLEDAREAALEQKLKREKEERRKKLESMANKRK